MNGLAISLPRVLFELRQRQRAGQRLHVAHVGEVEAHVRAAAELVAEVGKVALAIGLAVVAVAVAARVGKAGVNIKGSVDPARRDVVLGKPEGSALAPEFGFAGVCTGFADQIDRAAKAVAAEAQGVGAFVNLDAFAAEKLEYFGAKKTIGVVEGEAVDQDVYPADVKVVAQAGTADGQLAFVRSRALPALD